MDFKSTLISIFTLLRPQDLMRDDSPDHHVAYKEVHEYQWENSHTSNDVDRLAREGLANRERGSNQGSIGEHKREPGHRKDHSTGADSRPVSRAGNNKKEDGQPDTKLVFVVAKRKNTGREMQLPPQP